MPTTQEPTTQELLERIKALEEQAVTRDELSATDSDGHSWSFSDFLGMGLTRRQALGALFFLMVYGGSLVGAITYATDPAQASHGTGATGDMAEQTNPLNNVWAHHVRPGDGASVVSFPDGISTDQMATELEDGSDVSGSRSFGTEYQNTNNYDLFVIVLVSVSATDNINLDLRASATSGTTTTESLDVYRNDDPPSGLEVSVAGRVPAGYYYTVEEFDNNGSIQTWMERGFTPN